MEFGNIIDEFLSIARDFSDIKKIILFGSFAKGKASKISDIDIAISGDYNYFELIDRIKSEINTLRRFDIIDYDDIASNNLKK